MSNQDNYYTPYKGPAGGWGALKATAEHLVKSKNATRNINTLLKTNQPKGFDCPGCAWGEKHHPTKFRFCENGAKAVNWEATSRTIGAEFFANHSVSWLNTQSDYFLEYQGRLTEPLKYNPETDHYEAISWPQAYNLIAETLNAQSTPDNVAFYTSGRASNEAAYLYQLFVRAYGTNNFPDCSNMCHEASGYGLIGSIGIGKGTVSIDDFDQADAVFVFGQNPGTNHPRMLETLRTVVDRGAKVLTFNNLKERGLERFQNPQDKLEMIVNGSKPTNTHYFCPTIGGDMALVRGMVKALIDMEDAAQKRGEAVFDHDFIRKHTDGIDAYLEQVKNTSWEKIVAQSGLSKEDISYCAEVYAKANSVITTWAMGITQHRHSVQTIHEIVNLLALRGNIGKPGAGACPVRGHSNVQGDRTMGINEKPSAAFLEALEKHHNFKPPTKDGLSVVETIQAMQEERVKVFIALGGNFAAATPDTEVTKKAIQKCELTVQISTKLNRSHLDIGKSALILPCFGRTDIDHQAQGIQKVTVEDSFSMVHASGGVLEPLSDEMKSEPAIIAGMAAATLGDTFPINWAEAAGDYNKIREHIEAVIPGFDDFNTRILKDDGFYLGNSARDRNWNTPTKKAQLHSHPLPESILPAQVSQKVSEKTLVLQTLRSHDQYNTTIYGMNDRYRGIKNERDIVFMNQQDIDRLGFFAGQLVSLRALWDDNIERKVDGFKLVPYDIPAGNIAAYYPETNPLVPLDSAGEFSNTPTSKSIAVELAAYEEKVKIESVQAS